MADLSERMSRLCRILKEIGWGGTATIYRLVRAVGKNPLGRYKSTGEENRGCPSSFAEPVRRRLGTCLVINVVLVMVVVGLGGCQVATTPETVGAEVQPTVTREPTEFVPTNTPTATPTDTPTPTSMPGPLGYPGNPVTSNGQWTPVIQEFDGVPMALVPAGCFRMGSEDGQDNERPVHEVCFEELFWIDVYEVTNEAFGSVGCESSSSEPDQPRNCVNWTDSSAHCEARGARLPTEAEWEYTARGPDGLKYPWGNRFVADNVVYRENDPGVTATVGSKPGGVSWVGAFDLSGNVWEWVNDWYDADYYGTLADGVVDPQGPGSGEFRVVRGGSWGDLSSDVRAANRYRFDPGFVYYSLGFRCARSYQP